jgi:alkylhydroperoxidase family enzyme
MRIDPVSSPYPESIQALFDRLPASWSPPFKLFTILARDERLLSRFMNGAVSYLQPSHVTVRQREVLLLRVTARCRCAYEWGLRAHYFSEEAGLKDAELYASVHGTADDPVWLPEDRLLVQMADELHDTIEISDHLWGELRAAFDELAILQLLMMAGYYRTVAYVANGLRLPLEPNVGRPFPAPQQ